VTKLYLDHLKYYFPII